jgi:hypothetical protein
VVDLTVFYVGDRDLPQNQEVFVGKGEDNKDSFCFDFMDVVDEENERAAALVHWDELGVANGMEGKEKNVIEGEVTNPKTKSVVKIPIVFGLQGKALKKLDLFFITKLDEIRVWIALLRLPDPYSTDIVMSCKKGFFFFLCSVDLI